MNQKVPKAVAAIIAAEEKRLAYEEAERKLAEEAKRQAEIAEGKKRLKESCDAALTGLPKWLHKYLDLSRYNDDMLHDVGRGFERVVHFLFKIPGLSPLLYRIVDQSFSVGMAIERYYPDKPTLEFRDPNSYSFEYALVAARKESIRMEGFQTVYSLRMETEKIAQRKREESDKEYREAEALKQSQVKSEEEALFKAIMGDPLAVVLVKAFMAVQSERGRFQEILNEDVLAAEKKELGKILNKGCIRDDSLAG